MTTDLPYEDDLHYPGPQWTDEPSRRWFGGGGRGPRLNRAMFAGIFAGIFLATTLAVAVVPGIDLDRDGSTGFAVVPPDDSCWAEAGSLWEARLAYARSCDEPRIDCDPSGEGWICSSREIGLNGPTTTPLPVTVTVGDQTTTTEVEPICTAEGDSLREAIVAYAETCTQPRIDCDELGDLWICSSVRLGPDDQPISTTLPPTSTTVGDGDSTTTSGGSPSPLLVTTTTEGGSTTSGPTTTAIDGDRTTTSGSPSTLRITTTTTTGSTSTTARITTTTTRSTTSTTQATTSTTRPTTTTTRPTTTTTRATTTTTRPVVNNGPFNASRDLLVLHFDHAPDPDDGHATVAGREIAHHFGINPVVVGGTYGENFRTYNDGSEAVMDATWGSGGWLNADANWSGSVASEASRWESTLRAGGDVWIAEGGQSDFTADVLRRVSQNLPGVDFSRRVHVVQHSNWNETYTTDADLSYVKNNTDYIKIADGNHSNGTADLSMSDPGFVSAARAGRFGSAWDAAFDYFDPSRYVDFSDTVEVLHIVGVDKSQVADVGDFADYFIR